MFYSVLLSIAISLPAVATVYWVCLIVGGGLLIVSSVAGGDADTTLGGGLDADVAGGADVAAGACSGLGADADADVGHTHALAGALAGWFSLQFVVYFVAMFGLIGVVLTHLTDTASPVVFGWAMAGGLAVGQGVHQLLRKLQQTSGDSTPQPKDFVNKLARVTVTITPPDKGEVTLRVGRSGRYVPAVSKHSDKAFKAGEEVAVVAYRAGVVVVVSREEFEFLVDPIGSR